MSEATGRAVTRASRALFLLLLFALALPSASPAALRRAPASLSPVAAAVPDSIALDGRVVYVDFWASWCVPCRASFPWMAEMRAKYRARGLEVVTIDLDRDAKDARAFLDRMHSPLPVIADPKGALAEAFEVDAMPTSFLFGRDGTLRSSHQGFRPADGAALESQINALLEEKPPK